MLLPTLCGWGENRTVITHFLSHKGSYDKIQGGECSENSKRRQSLAK